MTSTDRYSYPRRLAATDALMLLPHLTRLQVRPGLRSWPSRSKPLHSRSNDKRTQVATPLLRQRISLCAANASDGSCPCCSAVPAQHAALRGHSRSCTLNPNEAQPGVHCNHRALTRCVLPVPDLYRERRRKRAHNPGAGTHERGRAARRPLVVGRRRRRRQLRGGRRKGRWARPGRPPWRSRHWLPKPCWRGSWAHR